MTDSQGWAWRAVITVSLAGVLGLAGCSSVPNWANPASWYDRVLTGEVMSVPNWANPASWYDRVFTDEPMSAEGAPEALAGAGADGFPAVANVPRVVPVPAGDVSVQGLIADRNNARYTKEILRQGGRAGAAVLEPGNPAADAAVLTPAGALAPARASAPGPLAALPPPSPVVPEPAPMPALPPPSPAAPEVAGLAPLAAPAPEPRPGDPAIPALAQPIPPVFQGGPQVNPLLQSGPIPIKPDIPFAGQARGGLVALVERAPPDLPDVTPVAEVAAAAVPAALPVAAAAQDPVVMPVRAQKAQVPQVQLVEVLPPSRVVGLDTLAQTFAKMLAQSGATVTTMTPLSLGNVAAPVMHAAAMPGIVDPDAFAAVEQALGISPTAAATVETPLAGGGGSTSVQFAHDSAVLSPAALTQIRQIADRYKEIGGRIRVVGHASSHTRDMPVAQHLLANFHISVDRVRAVTDEFVRLGIGMSVLTIDAVSDLQPVLSEAMPAGQAANRRVEIFLGA